MPRVFLELTSVETELKVFLNADDISYVKAILDGEASDVVMKISGVIRVSEPAEKIVTAMAGTKRNHMNEEEITTHTG